jgi:N-acetylmuramoyl-L-alanine amidase
MTARRNLLCAAIAALSGSLGAWPVDASPGAAVDRFDVVVIDAGHGGEDDGALGSTGLVEKELVLDLALRVAEALRGGGVEVVLTRREDRFVGLEERTSIANDARADLFVSIHANASRVREAGGVETFFASLEATDESARALAEAENQALGAESPAAMPEDPLFAILGDMIATEHLNDSQDFARLAQRRLAPGVTRSRGVKQAPFVVLMGVQMPAALVEVGFVTNRADERRLRSAGERDRIVAGLVEAIREFGRRYDARRGEGSEGGR